MAAPVLTGDVAALDHPGRTFTVLGVDPFAEAPFRPYLGAADAPGAERRPGASRDPARRPVAALVTRPGAVLVARPTARDLGLAVGDRLSVRVAGMRRALTVAGILEPADPASARALDGLLVTDIATAQEIFGAAGRLSRIDLDHRRRRRGPRAPRADRPRAAARARSWSPPARAPAPPRR